MVPASRRRRAAPSDGRKESAVSEWMRGRERERERERADQGLGFWQRE
jgi:hypothetical protein